MAETLSLMEFLQALHADAELRSSFGRDPQGTLAGHGLADLSPADVHDALVLVQDNQTVDFALDSAPPPPPPAGDGHEAAVEYLARYLDGSPPAVQDVAWTDVDPDAAAPVAVPDTPFDAFGADEDLGYGAGAVTSPGDPAGWDPALDDPGAAGPAPADGFDLGGYDDPDASGVGPGIAELDLELADLDADLDAADPDGPDEDPGPALSGGA
ncbi:IniB N-terminal domain-containing protein [Pseudonocardia kunmingensis]|uniref:Uncharacterized protein n=1 Tax=Pseudonocardia kunmingensis TaxID=630975 RepID=A0A543E357_9PSEU|nr:IniB N-terminal domain-containing protein [Pseudonocardia kunmingensis]TQM16020.1 hypothetical protein FB558_2822 [Pseudonocardia kunmingensis]